jgi:hypothetical protein
MMPEIRELLQQISTLLGVRWAKGVAGSHGRMVAGMEEMETSQSLIRQVP